MRTLSRNGVAIRSSATAGQTFAIRVPCCACGALVRLLDPTTSLVSCRLHRGLPFAARRELEREGNASPTDAQVAERAREMAVRPPADPYAGVIASLALQRAGR